MSGRGSDPILVVGGTGMLGHRVARRLVHDGFRVRLLTRDPDRAQAVLGSGFECVVGDVEDEAVVGAALDGCAGVHVSLSAGGGDPDRVEHRGTARVAELAAERGVTRITHLSQMLVSGDSETPEHRAKFLAEGAVRGSGVPHTIFKPTYFTETLPRHVRGGRAIVMGGQPSLFHMVAADDFAGMVSRAFRTPEAANRTLFVHGPEPVTIPDALRLYCSLVEPDKRVASVPLPLMSALDTLFMRRKLRGTIDLMRAMQRSGERGDPSEANELLGPPTTTLRSWCEQRSARTPGAAPG